MNQEKNKNKNHSLSILYMDKLLTVPYAMLYVPIPFWVVCIRYLGLKFWGLNILLTLCFAFILTLAMWPFHLYPFSFGSRFSSSELVSNFQTVRCNNWYFLHLFAQLIFSPEYHYKLTKVLWEKNFWNLS